jgi:hypothetical protein
MTLREISKLVEGYIGTSDGYLKHFSYSKHDTFYHVYCDLDIDVHAYRSQGLSTQKAFIQILKAQFGFQGVDSAPSCEGRSSCIGLLCHLV